MNKLLLLLVTLLSYYSFTQKEVLISDTFLIRFQEGVDGAAFIQQFQTTSRSPVQLKVERQVSTLLNIYKVSHTSTTTSEDLLPILKRQRQVLNVGYDTPATYRNVTPNDDLYDRQWNLERIGLPDVWEETTGGTTANGDEIVLAVLEKGITIDHPDFATNIWTNGAEIPDNGIDDDNNGYIDDYQGLNMENLTDNHPVLIHGTQVTGIIGASTNNEIGIAGINWDIKILFLSSVDLTSEAIEAYEYIYNLRKKYNETRGREGAFIVANNNSFGWDNTRPEELQFGVELCEMYNLLGSVGVLSVGAGPNNDVNVDQVGDTPTNCSSRFFIGVTSTNRDDEKSEDGGFGTASIDIGAPGDEIRATSGDDYCNCSGTSFAAPHLTGAIGLLYSIPCSQLAEDALNNASGTARFMKDIILAGTDPIASLQSRTVSGGRLNVLAALDNLQAYCGNNKANRLSINSLSPIPADQELVVEYETPDFDPYLLYITNAIGQLVYEETISPPRFAIPSKTVNVAGLSAGVYLLTIQRGGRKVTEKFVVR